MIARIWRGTTRDGMGEEYLDYLRRTGMRDYAATPGCLGAFALRRPAGGGTDYLVLSFWRDLQAVRRFAGDRPEQAVYYPEDDRYFAAAERRESVEQFEVADALPLADLLRELAGASRGD